MQGLWCVSRRLWPMDYLKNSGCPMSTGAIAWCKWPISVGQGSWMLAAFDILLCTISMYNGDLLGNCMVHAVFQAPASYCRHMLFAQNHQGRTAATLAVGKQPQIQSMCFCTLYPESVCSITWCHCISTFMKKCCRGASAASYVCIHCYDACST